MSFNPLTSILNHNKLIGSNYVDWRRNLDIVLTAEGYKYVLTTPCPETPGSDAQPSEVELYQKWVKADEMARCYMLASMTNILQHQHQSFGSAYDIIMNLKEMFGDQGRSARQKAMWTLMNTRMTEGTPVREHVLKMIDCLNTLEVLGAEIDGESQVDIVLESLPDSFNQFKLNYSMNKLTYTLAGLMSSLQTAEGIVKGKSIQNVEASSSKPKPKGKGKKKVKNG